MTVTKDQVRDVRAAWWEGWARLGQHLATVSKREHQILSVEMLRTRTNQTVAVFTVLGKDGAPHQFVVAADARGRNARGLSPEEVKKLIGQFQPIGGRPLAVDDGCDTVGEVVGKAIDKVRAAAGQLAGETSGQPQLRALAAEMPVDEEVMPDGMALGSPPPKEPPPPGVTSVGAALLSVAFDVGEEVPVDA